MGDRIKTGVVAVVMSCCICSTPYAAEPVTGGDAIPDHEELESLAVAFDGTSSVLLPMEGDFDLASGVTLETWLAANWQGKLGYDPCVLALMKNGETVLSVRLDNDRNYIGLNSGDEYGNYAVDIDPGKLNHLAVVAFGNYWEIFFNGRSSGLIKYPVPAGSIDSIDVGGCGKAGPSLVGWLSNLRVWNAALTPVDIYEYKPVTTNLVEEDHPYLPLLKVYTVPGDEGATITAIDGLPLLEDVE